MLGKVARDLLGADGRISRTQFWLGILIVLAMLAATFLVIMWLVPIFAVAAMILAPLTIVMLCVKRLHDRNRSGWWVLVFVVLPNILDNLQDKLTEGTPLWWVLVLAGIAVSLWGLIEIGFLRGTDGDNDYGPDPLAIPAPAPRPAPSDDVGSTPAPGV
jgi:uncharacterized membrane protein YhaH (DUF805 family)